MKECLRRIKAGLFRFANRIFGSALIVGLASLLWLIIRSGRKPSRMAYPCQKTAAANVGILLALSPGFSLPLFIQKLRCPRQRKKILRAILPGLALSGLLLGAFLGFQGLSEKLRWRESHKTASHGPLGIMLGTGIAAAILACNPPPLPLASPLPSAPPQGGLPEIAYRRVVSVYNPLASSWTGSGNPAETMNQAEIRRMVIQGLRELTGKESNEEAWQAIIPYQAGQAVAIKLNFNNTYGDNWDGDPSMNPYAELVNAIIEGLVSIGIPAEKIWLSDPSRVINDTFRNRISNAGVRYFVRPGVDIGPSRPGVYNTSFVTADSPHSSRSQVSADMQVLIRPAQVFVDASHIINIPQLKGHGGASITLGLKNHFGSIFIDNVQGESDLHQYFYLDGAEYGGTSRSFLADISANPVFKNKTRLVIGDGLMGHPQINWQDPALWSTFGNQPPEILFFGIDPVACDSVMFDYLQAEALAISATPRNDDILHYAAAIGLGIHEHWNNATDKDYAAIDYIELGL